MSTTSSPQSELQGSLGSAHRPSLFQAEWPALQAYYDDTWFDYHFVWVSHANLSIHFGYYDDDHRTHGAAVQNMNRVMADAARIAPGARVLDAGCGVGGSSVWLARNRHARVVGITPVESQIERARGVARGLEDRVRFERLDYRSTGLQEASFDVVWALESVCHAPDKADVYREFQRLLRPGGRLVMAEYVRASRDLDDHQERVLDEWLGGWAIGDIDTGDEHRRWANEAGFVRMVVRDITANTRPSLRRLYLASHLGVPIDRVLYRLGLRNAVQHGNVVGSRRQYQALQNGCWFYALITAEKPE